MPDTVSVPPTVKLDVPPAVSVAVAADALVVKARFVAPEVTLPPVVVMLNERLASPATVNESAELVEPGAKVTSLPTEPTPAAVTVTVPPVPVVKRPKLSAAPLGCVNTIGATIVADAVPVAEEVLPEPAKAGVPEAMAMPKTTDEARMIFFTFVLLITIAPQRPGLGADKLFPASGGAPFGVLIRSNAKEIWLTNGFSK